MSKGLIEQLQEQLAASQAREAKLREALEKIVRFNSSNEYTEVLSAYITNGRAALSQPADDTALRELITKAGEVMREEVIEQCVAMGAMMIDGAFAEEIRALPALTLEDLK